MFADLALPQGAFGDEVLVPAIANTPARELKPMEHHGVSPDQAVAEPVRRLLLHVL